MLLQYIACVMLLSLLDTFTKRVRAKMYKKYIKFSSYLAERTTFPLESIQLISI